MRAADAEAGRWVVDVDGHTTDGSLIVTIRSPDLYLDFWCPNEGHLRAAAEFLRTPIAEGSLRLGSFCGTLAVELDCFRGEPDAVYLSVTRADEQSMAYCLRSADRGWLAQALSQVAEALAQASGGSAEQS
jgi:hypothetical protein